MSIPMVIQQCKVGDVIHLNDISINLNSARRIIIESVETLKIGFLEQINPITEQAMWKRIA